MRKAAFGYVPHKTLWKDLLLKLIGVPNSIRRLQAPVIMRMLHLHEEDLVLDAGCGGGSFCYEINQIAKCIGMDAVFNNNPKLPFSQANVLAMPFKKDKFDKIVLSSVLQMVDDDKKLLDECHNILKKSGLVVLSVPSHYVYVKKLNEMQEGLIQKFGSKGKGFYTKQEVMSLLKDAGYEIIEMEYAPKKIGSFIYEYWLYFCHKTGLPLFHVVYFFFMYPLMYFDKFSNRNQVGNEIIIKAKCLN